MREKVELSQCAAINYKYEPLSIAVTFSQCQGEKKTHTKIIVSDTET